MASETGRAGPDLSALAEQAPHFDFFQLVRLLQGFGDGRRVGGKLPPEDEPVRFRSGLSVTFAASDVQAMQPAAPGHAPKVTVNFLGVANPSSFGALPTWYAMAARAAQRQGRSELQAFFELFDDRLIGLTFRAWARHHLAAAHEADPRGAAYRALLAVIGLATAHLGDRLRCDERALVAHAGALARRPAPVGAVEDLVLDYFGLPCRVEQCVPVRAALEPEETWRLGDPERRLGVDTVLGSQVAMPQHGFRVVLGPLDRAAFRTLQPTQPAFAALVDLVRFAVGPEFDFDVQLLLDADEVPQLRLGFDPDPDTMLGWSSWLGIRTCSTPAGDATCPATFAERDLR